MRPPRRGVDPWSREDRAVAVHFDREIDRLAADRLARALVRVHPSFRFEERLARELAELAASLASGFRSEEIAGRARSSTGCSAGSALPSGPEPAAVTMIPRLETPSAPGRSEIRVLSDDRDPAASGRRDQRGHPRRPVPAALRHPLVIGGAITSAAISVAGAAFLAWRRTHHPRHPMARAVRLAQGGLAAADLLPARSRRRDRWLTARGPVLLGSLMMRTAGRIGTLGAAGTTEPSNARLR